MFNIPNFDLLKTRETLITNTKTANTTMEDNTAVLSESCIDNEDEEKKLFINKVNNGPCIEEENSNKIEICSNENINKNLLSNKITINDISSSNNDKAPFDNPEKSKILFKQPKILFYTRETHITGFNRRLLIRINFGEYKNKLPSFIFSHPNFTYTPHYLNQAISNKGIVFSFPNLISKFHEQVVLKNADQVVYTYYNKQNKGGQTNFDIKRKDSRTLIEGNFLSEAIVDFYLQVIKDEYIPINNNWNILIVKNCYSNLLFNQQIELNDNFTYPNSCSFDKTKINIFNFKTLIIPISENFNWSLIIIHDLDKMKNIFVNEENDGNNNLEYPQIYYLDSYYINYDRRIIFILKFLFYEYQKIYDLKIDIVQFINQNFHKIKLYFPDVPKPQNNNDSGIFILAYAELFLFNPEYFLKNAKLDILTLIKNNNNRNVKDINQEKRKEKTNDDNNKNNQTIVKNEIIQKIYCGGFKDENNKDNENNNINNDDSIYKNIEKDNNDNNKTNSENLNIYSSKKSENKNKISLTNWFTPEFILNYRRKICSLINNLSFLKSGMITSNENEYEKIENEMFKRYFDEQKKEIKENFSRIEISE